MTLIVEKEVKDVHGKTIKKTVRLDKVNDDKNAQDISYLVNAIMDVL